ncbi:MAG: response regulator [Planctomycetota bacterium]|jgi:DNA-binding response OmpR family regulator
MRILIIEDDAVQCKLAQVIMAPFATTVDTAEDGIKALAMLADNDAYDIILLDWHMPRLDGLATLAAIRREERFGSPAIFMLTAEASVNRVHEAFNDGADHYLLKPIKADHVRAKLAELGLLIGGDDGQADDD